MTPEQDNLLKNYVLAIVAMSGLYVKDDCQAEFRKRADDLLHAVIEAQKAKDADIARPFDCCQRGCEHSQRLGEQISDEILENWAK